MALKDEDSIIKEILEREADLPIGKLRAAIGAFDSYLIEIIKDSPDSEVPEDFERHAIYCYKFEDGHYYEIVGHGFTREDYGALVALHGKVEQSIRISDLRYIKD